MKKERLFTNRQLLTLLWPLIIEQMLEILVGMADTVMVSSVGEAAISAGRPNQRINQLGKIHQCSNPQRPTLSTRAPAATFICT